MPLIISTVNYIKTVASIHPSQQSTGYTSTNLSSPERPFLPWRSNDANSQTVIFDFGSAVPIDLVGFVNANWITGTLNFASSSGFTAPAISTTMNFTRNLWNHRYQHTVLTTSPSYRYLRFTLPTQTPTDGSTFISLGGLWAGARTSTPTGLRWNSQYQTVYPHRDVVPEHGGWRQRITLGEPVVSIRAGIVAHTHNITPGLSDELRSWQEIVRQVRTADIMYWYPNLGDVSQGMVVRSLDDFAWTLNAGLSEAVLSLEEVVAG